MSDDLIDQRQNDAIKKKLRATVYTALERLNENIEHSRNERLVLDSVEALSKLVTALSRDAKQSGTENTEAAVDKVINVTFTKATK